MGGDLPQDRYSSDPFLLFGLQTLPDPDTEDLEELKEQISDMLDDAWNLPPANRKKVRTLATNNKLTNVI
jgi:hypothetical protein